MHTERLNKERELIEYLMLNFDSLGFLYPELMAGAKAFSYEEKQQTIVCKCAPLLLMPADVCARLCGSEGEGQRALGQGPKHSRSKRSSRRLYGAIAVARLLAMQVCAGLPIT